jgi:hypothetical protein
MKLYCHQKGAALMMLLMMLGVLGSFFAMQLIGQASQQVEKERATQKLLVEARDALLGFAATFGRLPCPASATSNGIESAVGGGVCTNPYNGFLPAVTLGLPGVDANGYLSDAWQGSTNRVRYAVTTASGSAATTINGIRTATMAIFGDVTPPIDIGAANLRVCGASTGITATTCGTATALTTNAVAVLFSLGNNAKNGAPGGVDEAANQNGDQVFVSHPRTDTLGANGEFDDLILWLPTAALFDRMTQGGKLP